MANLKEIRSRIATVKNTQKITRAMYLVAAARLRKAQENILNMRPYAQSTMDMIARLAQQVEGAADLHPLLAKREPQQVMLVCLSSDRGLAGGFNAQVTKAAYREYQQLIADGKTVQLVCIGRKATDFFNRRGVSPSYTFSNVYEKLSYEKASEIGETIIKAYTEKKLDLVRIVYNEFKSAIAQEVVVQQVLPIEPKAQTADPEAAGAATQIEYIYDPDQQTLLNNLLPLYVNVEIYRDLLESVAAEHGARMTAMDNATKNAKDMIRNLTLQANRARQAAITTELTEIVSGAEALNG